MRINIKHNWERDAILKAYMKKVHKVEVINIGSYGRMKVGQMGTNKLELDDHGISVRYKIGNAFCEKKFSHHDVEKIIRNYKIEQILNE